MTDNLACDEVDDVFGDVGHEVTDTFEFASGPVDQEACCAGARLRLHEFDGFVEERAGESVEQFVLGDDLLGEFGIFIEQCPKEFVTRDRDAFAEFLQRRGPLKLTLVGEFEGHLGDRASVVGDALEIGVDFEDEGELAKVAGKWVLQGHEAEAGFLDFHFFAVDSVIALEHLARVLGIEFPERRDGRLEHADGGGGLVLKAAFERVQIADEVRGLSAARNGYGRSIG